MAFVGASPRRFAPLITTVPAEGPSAEWFDRSLPRHPPEGRTWRLSYTTATPLSSCRHTPSGKRVKVRAPSFIPVPATPCRNVEDACLLRRRGRARIGLLDPQLVDHLAH